MHQIDKNDSALSVFVEFVELVNSTIDVRTRAHRKTDVMEPRRSCEWKNNRQLWQWRVHLFEFRIDLWKERNFSAVLLSRTDASWWVSDYSHASGRNLLFTSVVWRRAPI